MSDVSNPPFPFPLSYPMGGPGQALVVDPTGQTLSFQISSVILASLGGIDGKAVANTLVYSNNSGKTAHIFLARVYPTASNAITVGPSLGFGTTAGTNNVFASINILALTSTTTVFGFSPVGMSVLVPNGGNLYLNLGTAATGTSQTIATDIIGYLR